jgi:TfoX/Sxy family transcriptional regulator of competence genes
MKLTKPSPGLIAEFKAVAAQLPQGEPRKMFGYDAVFVNGNMAVGLWQNTCVMKLTEADQTKLLGRGQAQPFAPMKGRVMTGWVELSEELSHDPEELLAWSLRAVDFAAGLPPKVRAAKKSKAKPAAKPKAPTRAKPVAKPKAAAKAKPKATVSKTKAAKSNAKRKPVR